jgi:transposase
MAMGTRKDRERQEMLWMAATEIRATAAHPFYVRLNELLDSNAFDRFVEEECREFYACKMGRPSLTPGIYFRLLLLGYFEGIDSERGIAWRAEDSLSVRRFLGIGLDEPTPDHSTISRTRRLLDLETHQSVFTWVLRVAAAEGLVRGNTIGIDATMLEANAALRSIVRRENGETYEEFLKELAKEAGIETPTREQLARMDRKRKKRMSNEEWTNPNDPDAKIAKMKDGSTHLAHKAEHAVDLETGAVVAVTLQGAEQGDTTTYVETLTEAGMRIAEIAEAVNDEEAGEIVNPEGPAELVADKGYHSNEVMKDLKEVAFGAMCRSLIVESATGMASESNKRRCTEIGGGCGERAANGS